MRGSTATSSKIQVDEDIDYNCIDSLRAFAVKIKQSYYEEQYDPHQVDVDENTIPQDADWDPEQES